MDATGFPNRKIIYRVDMENVHSWTAHTGPVLALVFNNRNDKLASAGEDGFIVVWDICAVERPVEQPLWGHTKPVRALQWSAVWSDRLASGADDGTVRIWDVETGEILSVKRCHTAAVKDLYFLGGGDKNDQDDEEDSGAGGLVDIPKQDCLLSVDENEVNCVWYLTEAGSLRPAPQEDNVIPCSLAPDIGDNVEPEDDD